MIKLKLQQFAAPGSLSALREETFDNLQLNVGIFLKNFDYDDLDDAEELLAAVKTEITTGTNLLGATRGGGTFSVSKEMRQPQVDGLRYRFKGGTFVDSTDPYLSTTLVETTPGNFAAGFGGKVTTSGKKTTVTMETALTDDSYLDNLCWVGDLADGRLVLINLYNALNTSNFTFTFQDKNEGSFAVEFHATQDSVDDYDEAPFEVVFFDHASAPEHTMTVTSAAGSAVGGTALTVSYTLATGQTFVYKVGDATTAPVIHYAEQADYTWTEWDGDDEISVGTDANGYKVTVAALDSAGRAFKIGSATLVVKTT